MSAGPAQLDNPTRIARETLVRLAQNRVAPTPDNYRQLYNEIAGVNGQSNGSSAERMLQHFAAELPRLSPQLEQMAGVLHSTIAAGDWTRFGRAMIELVADQHGGSDWATIIRNVVRQMEARQKGLTTAQKKEMLERVLANNSTDGARLQVRLQALLRTWAEVPPAPSETIPESGASRVTDVSAKVPRTTPASEVGCTGLRDLLSKTLRYGLVSQLHHDPDLATDAEALAQSVYELNDKVTLAEFSDRLKRLWFQLEIRGEDGAEQREGLLRLLRLLLDNIGELLTEDQWLHGQIVAVRDIIAGPLSARVLDEAERSLKEVIYKQGGLKHGLDEAKATLKGMITTLINRMGDLSEATGEYHDKIERYSQKISQTDNIVLLGDILDDILRETRVVQASTLRSQGDLEQAKRDAEAAELKIRQLEAELSQVGGLVRVDPLTGSLNRRGLDDHFVREMARSDRQGTPLSVALIDIDNFKQINDRLGHQVGDEALVHLVRVVKQTVRPTDVIARFGGEEFVILLPDTELDDAIAVAARLQREMTKTFFLHNNERLLITFSAGVALRDKGEPQDAVISRADAALYEAKRTGKNRVVAAPGT